MSSFPSSPVPADAFFERHLPEAFAAATLSGPAAALDLTLGVRLEGEGGGEWCLALAGGALEVACSARDAAPLSVVLSVDDWRGALWEGRGGGVGRLAAAFFDPARLSAATHALPEGISDRLRQATAVDALLRAVVREDAGEWSVGVKLGPGALPKQPNAIVSLDAADVAALERGELNPIEAFMAGRIQLDGDIGLLMQLQAIALGAG